MPRRHKDLFGGIASFPALCAATERAARGKRRAPSTAAFLARQETEVIALWRALRERTYRPGRYTTFEIHDPKRRQISAAPFRDRVVHQALCTVIEPIFERGFIHDSYANRIGKGTHRAVRRYEHYRDRHAQVLRADIYRYFPAIDHAILQADLRRRIACPDTLWLIDTLIDASNPQEPVDLWFPGDDLLTPLTRRRGLPIGNLTSQFFANVYLDRLDHFVKEVLRAPGYVRYVDDFALFHDDPAVLAEWRERIATFLVGRRLRLHPRKTFLIASAEPATFLGYELHPGGHRRLPEASVRRFRNRLRGLRDGWRAGTVAWPEVQQRVQAWIAHAEWADTWRLRHAIFRGGIFDPARRPDRPPVGGASCAAGLGTTTPGTCARPTATGTTPATGTTTSVSAWPVRSQAGAGASTDAPGEWGSVQGRS
jgi:retron-type reverse transcriptase